MSETRSIFPDFYKDLTVEPSGENRPEVGPEEMAEVANLFNQTFEGWLAKYNQSIEHLTMPDGRINSRLLQGIQSEGQTYALAVEEVTDLPPGSPAVEDLLPSEDIKRGIALQLGSGLITKR